ncbi:hypothetical protein [Chitinophaga filiformis]|uniref:Uncharacterized protein n=1 Tax=Chitinophaga filiformis TaxID=104663 RepID=A0A1G7RQX3_CHIFI|nr:hypothetical protein [Chitinophaga filiformis]SDG13162.1 hypothetical protein SAMN04488121_103576 [Chitinophaga filiformis]
MTIGFKGGDGKQDVEWNVWSGGGNAQLSLESLNMAIGGIGLVSNYVTSTQSLVTVSA